MDPMNDDALARELERALAIEPSPEFVARVRTRIAEEPSRSSWRFGWLFAGVATAAVAAALVLAVVVVSPVRRTTPPSAPLLASRSIASTILVPDVSPANRLRQGFGGQEAGHDLRKVSRSKPDLVADTLFDTRETMALQRLIAGVREGKIDLNPVQNASTPTVMDLPPVVEIFIPPITITPLGESGQGERQ